MTKEISQPPWTRALVLGGARSGKSARGEAMVRARGGAPVYIATAQAWDDEMADRIAQHRRDRGDGWRTIEAPRDLVGALDAADAGADAGAVLVDCLTLWLSNVMLAEEDVAAASAAVLARLGAMRRPVVCVSNEVGLGVVPDTPLGRRFRDAQGRLNQQVAALAEHVVLMAAGLPLVLK